MSASRDALFDLAVNRAAEIARRLGVAHRNATPHDLEVWYLKTRFASRVPFEQVLEALRQRPAGTVHWVGGPGGAWRRGPTPAP